MNQNKLTKDELYKKVIDLKTDIIENPKKYNATEYEQRSAIYYLHSKGEIPCDCNHCSHAFHSGVEIDAEREVINN